MRAQSEGGRKVGRLEVKEDMRVKICANTYRMFFIRGGEDVVVRVPMGVVRGSEARCKKWREWLKNLEMEKEEGSKEGEKGAGQGDVEMEG